MRIVTTPEIDRLVDMQTPYVFFDKTKGEVRLREDAPIEVDDARKRFLAWMKAQRGE